MKIGREELRDLCGYLERLTELIRGMEHGELPYFYHPYVKPTTKKFITFFEVFRAAS